MPPYTNTRERLALWVVLWGLVATAVMACVAIICAGWQRETADSARSILTTVLPVIGTWVGTVLAFYFARENFESAARQTRLLLGQHLDAPAKDFAIDKKDIKHLTLPAADGAERLELQRIRDRLRDIGKFRLPILDETGRVRYVVHQQPMDSFLTDQIGTQPPIGYWSLKDLLDSPVYGIQVRNSFAVISMNATMAEAKAAMEARPHCQDVFLTANGRLDEPVESWLTNNEIQRAASA